MLRVSSPSIASLLAVTCIALFSTACGGGPEGPPPPQPDFALSISPGSIVAVVGNATSPVTLSVLSGHGFDGAVAITLQGIPQGVTASPSSSFSLAAGTSQSITLSVSASATVGTSSITAVATSGTLSHTAQIMLTAEAVPTVRTFQIGSTLYLESDTPADTSRIGLETMWGGSIVEVSLNGTNFVNAADTGREVQPAFREGKDLNWNPTLGGDVYNQGTPTLAYAVTSNSLYTRAQSLQWTPDFYGGGPGLPITGDMLVEQTITAVTSQLHTFKLHYKATHLGSDLHTDSIQELPAVYTNQDYNRFVHYDGTAPWANAAVTSIRFPNLPTFSPVLYVPEHWGALVDAQNMGLTIYAPSNYPYAFGFAAPDPGPGRPTDNATNYFVLSSYLTIAPNVVLEGDVYLIAGDYVTARQIVYQLHRSLTVADTFMAVGETDTPSSGNTIRGITSVDGWAFDDVNVSSIEILVDGAADGTARYGLPRPDVLETFPHAPVNTGFSYSLDTDKYANGPHTLNVRVTDSSGHVAVFADVAITVSN